jgi:hypothetical protein
MASWHRGDQARDLSSEMYALCTYHSLCDHGIHFHKFIGKNTCLHSQVLLLQLSKVVSHLSSILCEFGVGLH